MNTDCQQVCLNCMFEIDLEEDFSLRRQDNSKVIQFSIIWRSVETQFRIPVSLRCLDF